MSENISTNGAADGNGMVTRGRRTPPARPQIPARSSLASFFLPVIVILVVAGAIIYYVCSKHTQQAVSLEKNTTELARNMVLVVHPERQSSDVPIVLPGTVQALRDGAIVLGWGRADI